MRCDTGTRVRVAYENFTGIGTVKRVLMSGDGAWVTLDADLPDALRMFQPPDSRARDLRCEWDTLSVLR